jgi:hypothetical protein
MAKPSGSLLKRLGPEVEPFERLNRNNNSLTKRQVLIGEKKSFDNLIIDATEGIINKNKIEITSKNNLNEENRYLWVIDSNGLYLLIEKTVNNEAQRKKVCHSNITKGKKALQGGELWFIGVKHIILNFCSGRYGAENLSQENAVIEYFESLGFNVELYD